jgi:predicted AAA+ superfamily ATPase
MTLEERHRRLLVKLNPWWGGVWPELPPFERDMLSELKGQVKHRQMIAIVGLRRVGKTVLLKQLMKWLSGPERNLCYISFDDIEFRDYRTAEALIDYFLQYSDPAKRRFLFLDEVQKLPDWDSLLKVVYDGEERLKIFISGSASLELKTRKESLAGRLLTFHVPVLSFREFVRYFGMDDDAPSTGLFREYDLRFSAKRDRYQELFRAYLMRGAFPELLETEDAEHVRRYIKESVIEKAVSDIARISGADERTVFELFRLLADSNARLFEIVKLANTLKVNRNLVSGYVSLLEKAFLIKVGYNCSASVAKQVRTSKKQYVAHSSIVAALLDLPEDILNTEAAGHLVEAAVASAFEKVSFWRTPRHEVDLIAGVPIEVKFRKHIDTKDLKGLLSYMAEYGVREGIVVTRDTLEERTVDGRIIKLIPAWLFLMMDH